MTKLVSFVMLEISTETVLVGIALLLVSRDRSYQQTFAELKQANRHTIKMLQAVCQEVAPDLAQQIVNEIY